MGRHLESGALDELTLTTNGSQLAKHAAALAAAGVRRINVSLDTLDAEKFGRVTRWGKLDAVLRGIEAAKREGMAVKINAVAIKDFNDSEVHDMIEWAGREDLDLTFIEVMPMGDMEEQERLGQYWPLTEVQKELETRWTLSPSGHKTGGPARYMSVAETGKRVGFITPLTHNFCESCNRVRLTCTGMLYMCLGQDDDANLMTPLRASEDDAMLHEAIREAIKRKPKGHDFDYSRQEVKGEVKKRFMSTTGG
jgi:cyclic pyranopterin phosphate synthase